MASTFFSVKAFSRELRFVRAILGHCDARFCADSALRGSAPAAASSEQPPILKLQSAKHYLQTTTGHPIDNIPLGPLGANRYVYRSICIYNIA